MPVAIRIEDLSKQYRLGEVGTGTISHDLNRWWAKLRGKPDPYAKVGQQNRRDQAASSDYVWVLKDINLEVEQGEVLGIIGANGAGKSTLLKLISRITSPTSGSIKAKGRIASLLEVGTGMHPEMTARENIFLNGAILGMRRHEITRQFDDIVDFAGCRMYVDTPVKRYSSGMRVRLGFAVAAFLEPEILIVDEVLAVGDAEFQDRALGKMQEVSSQGGRTILFVSHHLEAVRRICRSALLLEHGCISARGDTVNVLHQYVERRVSQDPHQVKANIGKCADLSVKINGKATQGKAIWNLEQPLDVGIQTQFTVPVRCPRIDVSLYRDDGTKLFTLRTDQLLVPTGAEFREMWDLRVTMEHVGINCCDGYMNVGVSEESGQDYSIILRNAWAFQSTSGKLTGLLPNSLVGLHATAVVNCSESVHSNSLTRNSLQDH